VSDRQGNTSTTDGVRCTGGVFPATSDTSNKTNALGSPATFCAKLGVQFNNAVGLMKVELLGVKLGDWRMGEGPRMTGGWGKGPG
jgi:hypothetical protein